MEPIEAARGQFEPKVLGETIRYMREKEGKKEPFVTLLLGAGFSRSAGIPVAGEVVQKLRTGGHPLLREAGAPPTGQSEYAYLMERLGSPAARAKVIRECVGEAEGENGRLKINWAHLLLASMVGKNFVRRILTTNFDPLVVEALAIMGQPIRTYDLSTSGSYVPDILDPGSVIYLHGQMHSMLLVNSADEMKRVRTLYPSVLQEAVRDSKLIVVGYSGENDPVLDCLCDLPNIPYGIWWSHFSRSNLGIGNGVRKLCEKHGSNCHIATGDDADTFMRKLVLDGMQLDVPDEVLRPFVAMLQSLERITPFPNHDIPDSDPVQGAKEILHRVQQLIATPQNPPSTTTHATGVKGVVQPLEELAQLPAIQMAVLKGDWAEFERLKVSVNPDPQSSVSQGVGDGLIHAASEILETGEYPGALTRLTEAQMYGVSEDMRHWLPFLWGNVLVAEARSKGNTAEGEALFEAAGSKYAEAVRIKSDTHEAFYNWGTALSEQAKLKGNTAEGEALFEAAGSKFAEAVRIRPDKHEAFNNWGFALSEQAKLKGNTAEGEALFEAAGRKYAEAVRIKPDKHEAFYNWGNALLDQAKLKGNTAEGEALLEEAGRKYAEAVRIRPDMHEAFNNWGTALLDQAKLKGNTAEGEALFEAAGRKYAEAVRIKPDKHEAFNNWGTALLDQAKLKGNTAEGEALFEAAGSKYAEAVRIKPDYAPAFFNLACLHALRGAIADAIQALRSWAQHEPLATRASLDQDRDFDQVRSDPQFREFRDSLPDPPRGA